MTSKDRAWVQDMCHSPGSTCDAEGKLRRLDLAGQGLQCPKFPAQVGQLSALRVLDMSYNLMQVRQTDISPCLSPGVRRRACRAHARSAVA